MVKHLGRIPAVIHTDHANIARVEGLPLERIEAKHFRWNSELRQGGSRLLHRPGAGTLHKAPDGISRHPEGRDRLILARSSEWQRHRAAIRGVDEGIDKGEFDDDEPEAVEIHELDAEVLAPVPYEELKAAGVLEEPAKIAIKEMVERSKAQARQKAESAGPGVEMLAPIAEERSGGTVSSHSGVEMLAPGPMAAGLRTSSRTRRPFRMASAGPELQWSAVSEATASVLSAWWVRLNRLDSLPVGEFLDQEAPEALQKYGQEAVWSIRGRCPFARRSCRWGCDPRQSSVAAEQFSCCYVEV